MLLKSCKRCGNLIPYGHEYCKTCEPIAKAEKNGEGEKVNELVINDTINKEIKVFKIL